MATLDSLLEEDGSVSSPQHVMVYGPPKSGKTQLIGELATQGFKLIWFDLECGKSTLLKMPRETLKNIVYIGVQDTKDTPTAHATIDKIVRGGTFKICDEHGRVDCQLCKKDSSKLFSEVVIPSSWEEQHKKTIVVIDSGTQLSMSIIHTITLGKPADYQETIHDFRNQGNYLNRIFSYLQQARFNFVITAHEIEAEREDGGIRIVPSIGSRNYAINCSKFFDHVVYLDKVNCKHKASSSTSFSNSILTGSRLDVAIERMDAPTLATIFSGHIEKQEEGKVEQAKTVLSGLAGLKGLAAGGLKK